MPPVQIFCNHGGPCSEEKISCARNVLVLYQTFQINPALIGNKVSYNQVGYYVYTKQSSKKVWCDLLHDPEIGSHIVLLRDLQSWTLIM